MPKGRSRRLRRGGAAPTRASVQPTTPANSSGTVRYDDSSPPSWFNQVQPIPAASLSSPSQSISASVEDNIPAPPQKQQLCINPKRTYAEITRTSLQVVAAGLVSSSRSRASAGLPDPEVADLHKFNYVSNHESLGEEFYNYLKANKDYEKQLHGTSSMNKKHGTSEPYAVRVSYSEMLEFNAGADLIRATCNSVRQNNPYLWLIPAGERFLHDNGCLNLEWNSSYPRVFFSGFPDSIQKLQDFKKNSLVEYLGQIPILATTFHGRLLIEMPMVTLSENHLQNYSWNGAFSEDDILIIKSSERRGVTTYETYERPGAIDIFSILNIFPLLKKCFRKTEGNYLTRDFLNLETRDTNGICTQMKILQKPMELEGHTLSEAMSRDLHKAAEIFIPLYEMGGDYPPHFLDFKKALRTVEEGFVGEIWFMKYLTHHPAIMSAAGRRTFWIKLHRALVDYNKLIPMIMRSESTACPYAWKAILESEFEAEKLANKDIIAVLKKVYRHKNKSGDKYKNTVCGLIKFIRNVLAHGMHDRCELELFLAKKFSSFLPKIMQDLLKSGRMETRYEAAWTAYEVSKLIKIDGVQVQVVTTTGGVRPAARLQLPQIFFATPSDYVEL